MRYLKQNTILIALLLVIILMITGFININSNRARWDFNLSVTEGDPNLLKDIEINGLVLDDYSYNKFKLSFNSNSNLKAETNVEFDNITSSFGNLAKQNERYVYNVWSQNGINYKYKGTDHIYDFQSDLQRNGLIRATVRKYDQYDIHGQGRSKATIPTNIRTNESGYHTRERCITELEGNIYMTVPTNEKCRGTNAIYLIKKFNDDSRYIEDESAYQKLIDIPVDENNMVRGLVTVGDKLCLMMSIDNDFVIKLYDTNRSKFIDECKIRTDKEPYEIYIQDDSLVIMLRGCDVYAFEVSNSITEVGKLLWSNYGEYYEDNRINMDKRYIRYKNNKFYILYDWINWDSQKQFSKGIDINERDWILSIDVYANNGKQVFSGEIDTDVSDDLIRAYKYNNRVISRNIRVQQRTYSYFDIK